MKKKSASEKDKEIAKKYEDKKANLINEICKNILSFIEETECKDENFQEWHKNKCNWVKKTMNDSKILMTSESFTYGQAQKWVNMTLKYLWLLDMLPNDFEKSLHVPLDSLILEKLKYKGVEEITGSVDTFKYKQHTWSDIDEPQDYKDLQKEIKKIAEEEEKTPIAWECSAWIEIAQKRKEKS